jgi:hypothetical protein
VQWLTYVKGWRSQAANLLRPYYHSLLAEALGAAGDNEGAIDAISTALSMIETSGER